MKQKLNQFFKTKHRMGSLLVVFLYGVFFVGVVSAAAYPEPTYGTAVVDGLTDDWDTNNDFFAEMYRAGNEDKVVESNLYVRYDCVTQTIFVLVLSVNGQNVLLQPDDAFVKLGNSDKLVDGNDTNNFKWVNSNGSHADGFEASAQLNIGNYTNLNVHVQVFTDGESQTSAVADRAIDLVIDCTPKFGTIIIQKITTNQDDQTEFTFNPSGFNDDQSFVLVGGGEQSFEVEVGNGYSIEEVIPDDWSLEDAHCDDQSPIENIDVSEDETVICTFLNSYDPPTGTLLVQKVVPEGEGDPNNPDQTFELGILNENGVGIAGATVQAGDNPVGLAFTPGSYGVAEADLATGWTLDDISCESRDGTSTFGDFTLGELSLDVELGADDRVLCTFTNTYDPPKANITIVKEVTGDDLPNDIPDFRFNYNSSFLVPNLDTPDPDDMIEFLTGRANFLTPVYLTDGEDSGDFFKNLPNGRLVITEVNIPANWSLDSLECVAAEGAVRYIGGSPSSGVLDLSIQAGDDITCTFTNSYDSTGDITIVKSTDITTTQSFEFDGDFFFDLKDGESKELNDLEPGEYDIWENLPQGWDLDDITCDTQDGVTIDLDAEQITIDLEAGDDITCTFNNKKVGSIVVYKHTEPANGTGFDFMTTFGDFYDVGDGDYFVDDQSDPGDYEIVEDLPEGWALKEVTCEGATYSEVENGVVVTITEAGEDASCHFTNTKTGKITIIKKVNWEVDGSVDPADIPDVLFDFDGDLPDFDLGDGDSITFELPGGTSYDILEDIPANWALTDITCDGQVSYSDDGVMVYLGYEDEITCTFTNEPDCTDPGPDLHGIISDDGTMGWVTNHSTALCTWDVGMASYEKYDNNIDNQVLFDYVDGVPVPPGETVKVTVALPECAVQVDLFYGPYLATLNGQRYKERLLDYLHLPGTGYCGGVSSLNSVSGYVVANGQGIPGVTVTLTNNEADGGTLQTVTNVDGFYGFEGVPFGSYQVALSGEGLTNYNMPATITSVEVGADGPATANFEAQMTPTAVTVSAIGTLGQANSSVLVMMVTFLLAVVTAFIWRRKTE